MFRTVGVLAFCTVCLFAVQPTLAAELTIDSTQGLVFGTFVAGSGGSVTVSTTGLRSTGGGVMLVPSSNGMAAGFTVTGDSDATYAVDLPPNGFVSMTGPGQDMAVNDFTRTPSDATVLLPQSGSHTLSVGGTLTIGASQVPGAYSGTFTVIVNYN